MERPEDHFYCPELPGPRQRQCPDCGGLLVRRHSEKQGLLCTETRYQCSFILCGATFKGYEEIVYRLKVPSPANPLIRLPRSPSQKHAAPITPGVNQDCCPTCGERLRKQLVPTDDPFVFVAYVECASNGCDWAASAPVELKLIDKEKPV
ncbi:hypothetical protein EQ826_23835 [Ectopseudomonas mendocina]|nr:ogr/Delta-like zinc finger family protein [Pseudomonas mendocina]TRO11764.1 hypothetical protein EQ828_23440 [Pseudomonas mendocina]TRO19810.1 hypothetical protein EQ826_23835 [Pseudomonas mendocina]